VFERRALQQLPRPSILFTVPTDCVPTYNHRWNFSLSPGWTTGEVQALKLCVMKYGVGAWGQIAATGLLPGKTTQQLSSQTQRLLGQQSLSAFTGLCVDVDRVRTDNEARVDAQRKAGLIIRVGCECGLGCAGAGVGGWLDRGWGCLLLVRQLHPILSNATTHPPPNSQPHQGDEGSVAAGSWGALWAVARRVGAGG